MRAADIEAIAQLISISVGRCVLRGVGRSQELFTLDPGLLRG